MENLDEFKKNREEMINMADFVPYEEFEEGEETFVLTENGLQEVKKDGE